MTTETLIMKKLMFVRVEDLQENQGFDFILFSHVEK